MMSFKENFAFNRTFRNFKMISYNLRIEKLLIAIQVFTNKG